MRSTYVIPGFEAFRTSGVQFIRPKGQNALFAFNGSGPWMVVDADLRFTANSLHPESDPLAASYSQPILNVNTNAGITSQSTAGGTIRNVTITQEDYLNAAGDNLIGIYVNESNPNIRIESSAYSAPDYRDTSAAYGAVGLYSKGVNATVNGMTVVGKARPQYPNIVLERGSGQGCSARLVQVARPNAFRRRATAASAAAGQVLPQSERLTGASQHAAEAAEPSVSDSGRCASGRRVGREPDRADHLAPLCAFAAHMGRELLG